MKTCTEHFSDFPWEVIGIFNLSYNISDMSEMWNHLITSVKLELTIENMSSCEINIDFDLTVFGWHAFKDCYKL